jgi:hypothetical protein
MRVPAHDRADILDDPSPLQLSAVPSIALCAAAPPTAPAVVVTGSRWLPAPSAGPNTTGTCGRTWPRRTGTLLHRLHT